MWKASVKFSDPVSDTLSRIDLDTPLDEAELEVGSAPGLFEQLTHVISAEVHVVGDRLIQRLFVS